MTAEPWHVLSDCPHCRTEAAVLEEMDPLHPACHLGVPARRHCRLCRWEEAAAPEPFRPRDPPASGRCPNCRVPLGQAARSGDAPCPGCGYRPTLEPIRAPEDLQDVDRALWALRRWAQEEGEDVDSFCQGNMGTAAAQVARALAEHQPVSTSFDVIAFLFPGGAPRGAAQPPKRPSEVPTLVSEVIEVPRELQPMDPRTPGRLLVSVMVADGTLRASEQRFVQRWLERESLPAPEPGELRVWRPSELGAPPPEPIRDRLLEAAVHLMHLDRERDGSEWRVIVTFARAWGLDEATLASWDRRYGWRYTSLMARLGQALDRLLS